VCLWYIFLDDVDYLVEVCASTHIHHTCHSICIPVVHKSICTIQDRRRKPHRRRRRPATSRCSSRDPEETTWEKICPSARITTRRPLSEASPGAFYSLWFAINLLNSFMVDALSYRRCLKPLMHLFIISLSTFIYIYIYISCYPARSRITIMLSPA